MMKKNSPYTAAMTGCAFLYYEFIRILPLLMSNDSVALLKDEILNNKLLQVNSQTSRQRFISEFKRRFNSVPIAFWNEFLTLSEKGQRAGLLYVMLKTYKLVFDFHFNVTIRRWNSVDRTLKLIDLMMEFNEISSRDEFVDSWTDNTKSRCASQYLTFLRHSGLIDDKTSELQAIHLDPSEYKYYINMGEEWFLEACLLYPFEINDIKAAL